MIQRFYVHNYRCLENFELPVSRRPSTLLIGKNGSGKSSVGRALEFLQQVARGVNRVGDLVKLTDFTRGRSGEPLRFEIEILLREKTYEYIIALELPPGFRELRVAEEKLTVDGQIIYSRDRAKVSFARSGDLGESVFSVDWHLIALPLIQVRSVEDDLSIFKTWLARTLILAPLPSRIQGGSKASTLEPNREVSNLGEWISGLLADFPASYTAIDQFLRKVMPDLKDFKNPIVGEEFRSLFVQFQQEHDVFDVAFRDLSDGEKCFFVCAVVLAANQAYGPILCFWDEPDNYLSVSEVGHFITDLRRSFQSGRLHRNLLTK